MDDTRRIDDAELDRVAGGAAKQRFLQHTVIRGDTLSRLAGQYRTTVELILYYNPRIVDRDLIQIGWVLTIPDNR